MAHHILQDQQTSEAHHSHTAQGLLQARGEESEAAVRGTDVSDELGHQGGHGGQGNDSSEAQITAGEGTLDCR